MCGVIGCYISEYKKKHGILLKNIFKETQIRGKHASGFSFIRDGFVETIKRPIPAIDLIEDIDFQDYTYNGKLILVGHIRYSTSDLRFNQPISSRKISIAHNGVVSQEDPQKWKYKTEGLNDSELILRSFEKGLNPLEDFPDSSQAVCSLWAEQEKIVCFRNGKRPLWYSKEDFGVFFTSTKDIGVRAGLTNMLVCDPGTQYTVASSGLVEEKVLEIEKDLQL